MLDGGAGNDTMIGGAGNDTYVVDAAGDVVTEAGRRGHRHGAEQHQLHARRQCREPDADRHGDINGTGNSCNNTLTGNAGNNVLDGGAGNDTMIGGAGNDTYVVDNAGDVVTELAGEGTDTVQSSVSYTLGANVENLTLTGTGDINGTGNTLNNTLTGNAGNNVLNGGAGNDTMIGGAGNDTYVVDAAGDVVTEAAGAGHRHGPEQHQLHARRQCREPELTGTADDQRHRQHASTTRSPATPATTSSTAAPATTRMSRRRRQRHLCGRCGRRRGHRSGRARAPTRCRAAISYTLGANVENLTLTGTAAINGTGNALNNTLTGNAGNNVLDGGAGSRHDDRRRRQRHLRGRRGRRRGDRERRTKAPTRCSAASATRSAPTSRT